MFPASHSERPISLSADCVRVILAGRKTQVRHAVDDPSPPCPLGGTGDYLWVREPWAWSGAPGGSVVFRATHAGPDAGVLWQPSKTLLREHSRLLLRIESVRRERLQDIPEDDLPREGRLWRDVPEWDTGSEREGFAAWWDSLHPREEVRWRSNPWVWVVSFVPVVPPIRTSTATPSA